MRNWVQPPPTGRKPSDRLVIAGIALVLCIILFLAVHERRHDATLPAPPPKIDVVVSTGTIGEGGSLSQSLGRAEIPPLEASQVERAIKPLFNPQNCRAQHTYEISRSTSGHFVHLSYWPNPFESYTVTRSTSGLFSAGHAKVPLDETWVGASGRLNGTLEKSMLSQGLPKEMVYRLDDLFRWRIDFNTEPRNGDLYKIVWKRHTGNGAVKDGDIICAVYQGKETGQVDAFYLAGEYFDVAGNSLRGEFLRAPIAYRRISSRFSQRRFHPILRYYRPHHGIDYSAARGTPAVSIGVGVVTRKGYESGLGNAVRVRHAGSYVSIYGHLMGYAKGIRPGAHVRQGQVVGYVGSTGLSTGPHLHFGFERNGQLINFLSIKTKNSQKKVPSPERPHFEEVKKQAQALLAQLGAPGSPMQILTNH